MLTSVPLFIWDAFALALTPRRRKRSRRRLIDRALREWRVRLWPGLPVRFA